MDALSPAKKAYLRFARMLGQPDRRRGKFENAHAPWLFAPGVIGLAYGFRQTDLGRTAEPVLVVHVRRKSSTPAEKVEAIPRQIRLPDGSLVGVDVRQQSMVTASNASRGAVRPKGARTIDRVTTWVQKGRRELLLTCAHVIDGNEPKIETLTHTWESVGVSTLLATLTPHPNKLQGNADQGLILPTQPQPSGTARWPRYTRLSNLVLDQGSVVIIKHGRQPEAEASVLYPQAVATVWMDGEPYVFADLIVTALASEKGDSGSPVVDREGGLVGYVIGDTSEGGSTMHCTLIQPIRPVLKSLGCSLPPQSSDPVYVSKLLAADALSGRAGFARASQPLEPDAREVDILARTLWGEARKESPETMKGVAHVVRNRLIQAHTKPQSSDKSFGTDIRSICAKRAAFPCKDATTAMRKVDESDPHFRRALEIAHATLSGVLGPDPTHGATHHAPVVRGRAAAKRAEPGITIGQRRFYSKPA